MRFLVETLQADGTPTFRAWFTDPVQALEFAVRLDRTGQLVECSFA